MTSYIFIILCVWTIGFLSIGGAVPWINPSLEYLDEFKDAEILKAVVDSMNDWQRKHDQKTNTSISTRIKRQDPTTSVCYAELGCFESSGPFGYLDMLPDKPEEINTKFLLYPATDRKRRRNSLNATTTTATTSTPPPVEIPFNNLNEAFEWAENGGFNATLPTKVLIHGFAGDCGYIWLYEMRSALMAVEDVNIICVDWQNGATSPNYVKATANTRLVGKQLAILLRGLVERKRISLKNTHLIGFSLGAHIAGFAGADLGNLSRITGLDPAGPLFESQDTRARLDQTDADFVDVIHSNGENLILGGLGSSQPMGHVDFYPNGGRMQKGCTHLFVGAVSDIIWSSTVEGRSLCNHRRAYKFFIDSISPRCHFPAFPCASYEDFLDGKCFPCTEERKCGNMGYYADRSKGRGQLYLITRDEEPFCAHQYHVKIETSPSQVPIKSYGKIQITLIGDTFLNETFMMTRKEDEEMVLGESISRILVPHPILSQPTRIQILYTAYSGWLSSGLTQWRMDKVTLMDSFGKTSSVCKKNLILDSGVPVTLPLYPGECNLPKESQKYAQDRIQTEINENNKTQQQQQTTFKPSTIAPFNNAIDISWQINDKENKLNTKYDNDDNIEAESSRAFNTRIINVNNNKENNNNIIREIVEPILRPTNHNNNKNGRSQDLDKIQPEITEPILPPSSAVLKDNKHFGGFKVEPIVKKDYINKLGTNNKEITYNFYESEERGDDDEWTPTVQVSKPEKWKRQESGKSLPPPPPPPENNPFEIIASTVQFLPQRLAKMFEQAEKYARETILPLVSTYTPKFITDFIAPREKPKYLPLNFDSEDNVPSVSTTEKSATIKYLQETRSKKSKTFNPPPTEQQQQQDDIVSETTTVNVPTIKTTPYTHIQKIKRKGETIEFVFPEIHSTTTQQTDDEINTTKSNQTNGNLQEISRKARDNAHVSGNLENFIKSTTEKLETTKKGIYINLPVFEIDEKKPKYIPLNFPTKSTKTN